MLSQRWQDFYMALANTVAKGSKDGSSQVGAILVRPDKTTASLGFNGFPSRIDDVESYLKDKSLRHKKHPRIVHAECNCLDHNRDATTQGYHMFVNFHPCDRCALRIANTGIDTVYFQTQEDYESRYVDEIILAKEILNEAGVRIIRYEASGQPDGQ